MSWRRLDAGLAAAASLWALAVLFAPLAARPVVTASDRAPFRAVQASAGVGRRIAGLSAALVYAAGGVLCHQRPERSLHLRGVQFPVCARCTGIYVGGALALLGATLWRTARPWTTALTWMSLGVGVTPNAATAFAVVLAGPTTNLVRLCAGLCLGAAVGVVLARSVQQMPALEVH